MSPAKDAVLEGLRAKARAATERAHAPYSGAEEAAALLLADGRWVPGVRVESASFSLTISPLLNALTTAVAAGYDPRDAAAAALSRPLRPSERAFLAELPGAPFAPAGDDACARAGAGTRPTLGERLDPFLDAPLPEEAEAGIALAREVAERAYVPASGFRVGCVLVTGSGRLLPGVNVEHADWSQILCAERSALGTALSYGLGRGLRALYLSCPSDPAGSPCGACRQLLVELAPEAVLWMDRGAAPPQAARPADLLPGSFEGRALLQHAHL